MIFGKPHMPLTPAHGRLSTAAHRRYKLADVCPLTAANLGAVEQHLLALSADDRRLRFGVALSTEAIEGYVKAIDLERDELFGLFDDSRVLIGVAHVALSDDTAELGVSVREGERGHGAGQALFTRAAAYARDLGISKLFMHCLAENAAMIRIARKAGMSVVVDTGDADAYLVLPQSAHDRRRISMPQTWNGTTATSGAGVLNRHRGVARDRRLRARRPRGV